MHLNKKFQMVKSYFADKRNIIRQRRELKRIPMLTCNVEHLRMHSSIDILALFSCRRTEMEWARAKNGIDTFNVPDGTGGVNPGDRKAIFYLIKKLKPSFVLEIGTFIGASTVHIGSALFPQHNGMGEENIRLVSVDIADVNDPVTKPWLKHGTKHSPLEMATKLGFRKLADFVAANSLEYLSRCQMKFDFIFLDGDHTAKTVYREIPLALKLLNKDGVILLHDYFPALQPLWADGGLIPGPFLATDRLKKEGADITIEPLGRLPWPTKLQSNITSLALLLRHQK